MTHSHVPREKLSSFNRFLVFAIVITAVAHFLIVNDLSTKGFVFKDLKVKSNDLMAQRQTMESDVSALASYQNLNPRIEALHLVTADSIHNLNWDQHKEAKQ